ncbi:MAG: nuclear transport factor 2 family protein [Planctomycetales bacterium]
MPTPLQLPAPIAAYFEADTGPGQAVADCFTPDAVVQDEGHTYHGQAEIRAWRADVATKFTYTCEPLAVEQAPDTTIVACKLTGNFPGSPIDLRFHFQLAGDKIRTLHIRP